MVTVHVVPAQERMSRLEFSGQVEYTEHVVHIGVYRCPWCVQHVEFRTQHFQKHEGLAHSNLKAPWPERFDKERPLEVKQWESFLDFHCPGCGAPVRLIYKAGDEWAMGAHGWYLTDVVEAKEWHKNMG